MPKVQTYDNQQVQEQLGGTPLQTAPRMDGMQNFGKAMVGLGQAMDKAKHDHDTTVARERITQYRSSAMNHLNNYEAMQGREAYDGRGVADTDLGELRETAAKDLDPQQSEMFNRFASEYDVGYKSRIQKHSEGAFKQWTTSVIKSSITVSTEAMGASKSIEEAAKHERVARAETKNLAVQQGYVLSGDEEADAKTRKLIELEQDKVASVGYKTLLDNMVERGQLKEAQEAWNNGLKDKVMSELHDNVEKMFKVKEDGMVAQNAFRLARDASNIKDARKILESQITDNPDALKLANQLTAEHYQLKNAESKKETDALFSEADVAARDGQLAQWKLDNGDAWLEKFSPSQRKWLDNSGSPGSSYTDPRAYAAALHHARNGNEKEMYAIFDDTNQPIQNARQLAIVEVLYKKPAEYDLSSEDKAAFTAASNVLLGPKPSKKLGKDRWNQKYQILDGEFTRRMAEWRKQNPGVKIVPFEDRKKIIAELEYDHLREDGGWFWFDKTVGSQDMTADELQYEINRTHAQEFLKSEGVRNPTDAQIDAVIARGQEQGIE